MFDKKTSEANTGEYETIVGPTIVIEGDFTGKGNILIQGAVNGSISTENDIFIENGASISANVTANNAIVAGEINGNLFINERLDLQETAKIIGDIEANIFNMQAGAVFNGKSTMRPNPQIQSRDKNSLKIKKNKATKETEE